MDQRYYYGTTCTEKVVHKIPAYITIQTYVHDTSLISKRFSKTTKCSGMCIEHGNLMLELDLTCRRELEKLRLSPSTSLSASGILPLPNGLWPRFLRTSCPLLLSLSVRLTLLHLLMFHCLNPLMDLFLVFLVLFFHFFPHASFAATFP